MTAAQKLKPLDWEAFLADEERSPIKREYVYGKLYAMAGGTEQHSVITSNCAIAIGRRLRPGCRMHSPDMKVRIRDESGARGYYPDCSVVCDSPMTRANFRDDPCIVVEVLSPSTRRIDEGEKWLAYLSLPSLSAYLLVDSERFGVVVWRRHGERFLPEAYDELEQTFQLPGVEGAVPLAEIYANVVWPAPTAEGREESDI